MFFLFSTLEACFPFSDNAQNAYRSVEKTGKIKKMTSHVCVKLRIFGHCQRMQVINPQRAASFFLDFFALPNAGGIVL